MDAVGHDSADLDDFVAVVGMAGRYPESPDLATFWDNLHNGRDCLRSFSDAELDDLAIPAQIYQQANFVRRGTILLGSPNYDNAPEIRPPCQR